MTLRYFISRVLEAIATVLIVVTLTFVLLRCLPGGPFDSDLALSQEVKSHLEATYHLDQPLLKQYLEYIGNIIRFDFGYSYQNSNQSISDLILGALPATLLLTFFTLLLSYLLGIPLGLWSASLHKTRWEDLILFFITSLICLPMFLIGPLLILVFSLRLNWLPPALLEGPQHFILPVVTLAIRPIATITRIIRASVLEIAQSDYVRTARAKGLSEVAIFKKHILRNSLIPIVSISGSLIAGVISGSFVVEFIFALPGIGHYFIDSVANRDYPLVLSLAVFYTSVLVFSNLLMDLLAVKIDNRIQVK